MLVAKYYQQEYQKIVEKILREYKKKMLSFNTFIDILSQNNIKFSCKDDLIRISKLFVSPFDKLEIENAMSYLKFLCVKTNIMILNYIVIMSGRSNQQGILFKDSYKPHSILQCLNVFKKKMIKLYGVQNNWFHHLGGIPSSNKINQQYFVTKINNLFRNTQHFGCIPRILLYFQEGNPVSSKNFDWINIKKKLNLPITKNIDQFLCERSISLSREDKYRRTQNQWKDLLQVVRHPKFQSYKLQARKRALSEVKQIIQLKQSQSYRKKSLFVTRKAPRKRTVSQYSEMNTRNRTQVQSKRKRQRQSVATEPDSKLNCINHKFQILHSNSSLKKIILSRQKGKSALMKHSIKINDQNFF